MFCWSLGKQAVCAEFPACLCYCKMDSQKPVFFHAEYFLSGLTSNRAWEDGESICDAVIGLHLGLGYLSWWAATYTQRDLRSSLRTWHNQEADDKFLSSPGLTKSPCQAKVCIPR